MHMYYVVMTTCITYELICSVTMFYDIYGTYILLLRSSVSPFTHCRFSLISSVTLLPSMLACQIFAAFSAGACTQSVQYILLKEEKHSIMLRRSYF